VVVEGLADIARLLVPCGEREEPAHDQPLHLGDRRELHGPLQVFPCLGGLAYRHVGLAEVHQRLGLLVRVGALGRVVEHLAEEQSRLLEITQLAVELAQHAVAIGAAEGLEAPAGGRRLAERDTLAIPRIGFGLHSGALSTRPRSWCRPA
jgi:hypothetical protein